MKLLSVKSFVLHLMARRRVGLRVGWGLAHSAIFGSFCAKISHHRTKERSAQKDAKITKIQSPRIHIARVDFQGLLELVKRFMQLPLFKEARPRLLW
jgi:hypothetical protein